MKFALLLVLLLALAGLASAYDCTAHPDRPCSDNGDCEELTGRCECDEEYTGSRCQIRRKSQLVAFLLGLFLGTVGADRFYLGYIGLGVAKLLLCLAAGNLWIASIVSVVCFLPVAVCGPLGYWTFDSDKSWWQRVTGGFCATGAVSCTALGTIFIVAVVILQVLCALAIFVWWIVDFSLVASGGIDKSANGHRITEDL